MSNMPYFAAYSHVLFSLNMPLSCQTRSHPRLLLGYVFQVRPLACRPARLLAPILRPLSSGRSGLSPDLARPLACRPARLLAPIPRSGRCRPTACPIPVRPLSPGRWKFRGIFRLNLLSLKCGVMFNCGEQFTQLGAHHDGRN